MKENGGEKKIRVQKEIKTAREKVVGKSERRGRHVSHISSSRLGRGVKSPVTQATSAAGGAVRVFRNDEHR